MQFTVLFSLLSCAMLLGVGTSKVLANGFFQEIKDNSPDNEQLQRSDDSYYTFQDDFILDQQSPHNFFNPYNQPLLPASKVSASKPSEVKVNMDNALRMTEIQEFDGELEQKSEKAFRENRLNAQASRSQNQELSMESEPQLSGIELSELTSSNLIISAQKKKFIEKLLPALLSDRRILLQDRERLVLLLSQFEQGNIIDDVDERWLRQLAREYHLQEIDDFQKRF